MHACTGRTSPPSTGRAAIEGLILLCTSMRLGYAVWELLSTSCILKQLQYERGRYVGDV